MMIAAQSAYCLQLQKIVTGSNLRLINATELMAMFGHINGLALIQQDSLVHQSAKANLDRLLAICAIVPAYHAKSRLFRMIDENNFRDDEKFDFGNRSFRFGDPKPNIPELKPFEPLQLSLLASTLNFSGVQTNENYVFYLGNLAAHGDYIDYNNQLLRRLGRARGLHPSEDAQFWQNANQFLIGASLTQNSPIPVIQKLLQLLRLETNHPRILRTRSEICDSSPHCVLRDNHIKKQPDVPLGGHPFGVRPNYFV